MKKSIGSMFLLFVLLTVLVMSGCAPAPTPEPTSTPVPPTFTPSPVPPTFTPEPTMTPTVTPTPLPPILTDGTDSWLLIGVSFTNTTKIDGYDKPAENGMVYLVVEFQNLVQKIPAFPSLKGTNKIDYSQVYVTDSLGNKYIGVNNGVKMVPTAGSSNFHLGDFAIFFQAMPEGTHGFHLYFSDFPVVDLGQ